MSSLFCSVIKPVLNLNLAPTDLSNRRLLRAQLRKLRRSLSAVQQQQASLKVIKHLRSHPWYWSAQHIALYQAADGELKNPSDSVKGLGQFIHAQEQLGHWQEQYPELKHPAQAQ